MEPLTYEAVARNPELMRTLILQARRERAETIHRLIVEAIKSLFTLRAQHASRPHLAAAPKA